MCLCVCVGEKCDIDCFLSSQKVTLTFTKYIKAMEMCGHITHTKLQQEFKMQPKQVAQILHLSFFRCSRLICSSTPRDRMFMQEYSTPILLAKHAWLRYSRKVLRISPSFQTTNAGCQVSYFLKNSYFFLFSPKFLFFSSFFDFHIIFSQKLKGVQNKENQLLG